MNQKEGTRWELRLGVFQVVVLLGLIMGLLTCIFFLGYFSGREVGHNAALTASLTNTIRMPIGEADQADRIDEDSSRKVASEVYARLNDNGAEAAKTQDVQKQADMPRLGAIDSTTDAPVDVVEGGVPPSGENGAAAGVVSPDPENTPLPSRDQLLKQVIELEAQQPPAPAGADTDSPGDAAMADGQAVKPQEKVSPPPAPTSTIKPRETPTPKATATPRPTKTPKVEKAQTGGEQLSRGWFAQIAAPRKKEDAAELSRQLRKSGFGVMVEVAQVRGEQYYRVLAGPENSKAQAEKLIEQLKREPYIQTQPFLRQIK